MQDTRETIMKLARATAQAHGYGGLSFRELAKEIGIKSASIHYHFPTKGDLGAALAQRYADDAAADFQAILETTPDTAQRLSEYANLFRTALLNENRMCLCNFLAAEYHDLPEQVKAQVAAFADLNVKWLTGVLVDLNPSADRADIRARAQAIHAAISGAQLAARSRDDVAVYDAIIDTYRSTGLIPA